MGVLCKSSSSHGIISSLCGQELDAAAAEELTPSLHTNDFNHGAHKRIVILISSHDSHLMRILLFSYF